MKSLSFGTATFAVVSSLASTAPANSAAPFAASTVTEEAQASALGANFARAF